MNVEAQMVIGDALIRLAAARGGKLDDVTSEVYLDDLQAFEPSFVSRACETLRKQPRRDYETILPALATIIAEVERIAREDARVEANLRLLPMPSPSEPTYVCLRCMDGFWETVWCPGSGHLRNTEKHPRHHGLPSVQCQHPRPHVAHTAAVRCSCIDTNPVIAEQRNKHRQYLDSKAEQATKGRAS